LNNFHWPIGAGAFGLVFDSGPEALMFRHGFRPMA